MQDHRPGSDLPSSGYNSLPSDGLASRPAPLSWFFQSTRKYTPMIAEIMVVAIVIRLLGLVQPFVLQTIIDRVLPFQREATLSIIVVILIVTMVFTSSLGAIASYLGSHMGVRLTSELGQRIFRHVLNLPLRYLQRWQVGEKLTRIKEIDTVRAFLTGTVSGIALDVIFAIIYIVALLSISPFLTMIVLIMLPLQIVAFGIIGPFIRRRMQEAFLADASHQSRLVEGLGNMVTVKSLASEGTVGERFQNTLQDSLGTGFRVTKLRILNEFVANILRSTSVILIIYFGSMLVLSNEITLGQLIAFHLLAERVSGPILSLSSIWEQWQGLRIARLRLGDLLNMQAEGDVARPALHLDGPPAVELEQVTFGYTPDHPVIHDLNLSIAPGSTIVVVGDSGCGKSTLAKLLSGLYEPDSGTISVDGRDLAECDPQSVRRAIAYLPQEPMLFSGSILDNLLLARPDASEDEIARALAGSASTGFVDTLPGGVMFEVGEGGSRLSGGQRQRIALARSLLTDPGLLILDEPTSALDAGSQEIVIDTLKRLRGTKSLVIITHQRSLLGDDVEVIDLARPALYRDRSERVAP